MAPPARPSLATLGELVAFFGDTTLGDIGGPGYENAYGDTTIDDFLALLIELFPDDHARRPARRHPAPPARCRGRISTSTAGRSRSSRRWAGRRGTMPTSSTTSRSTTRCRSASAVRARPVGAVRLHAGARVVPVEADVHDVIRLHRTVRLPEPGHRARRPRGSDAGNDARSATTGLVPPRVPGDPTARARRDRSVRGRPERPGATSGSSTPSSPAST